MAKAKTAADPGVAVIHPANIVILTLRIIGTAPLVMLAFGEKARQALMAGMETPKNQKKSKAERPPRNYDEDFKQAHHFSATGWVGVPCAAYRDAMISACRTVSMVMTRAKLAILSIQPDGIDVVSGQPLVRLIAGEPERTQMAVRNANGSIDIRIRPMWREWAADVRVEFDADMITAESVVNLLDRAGRQVGIGEGRPFSKNSTGQGWGTFTVQTTQKEAAA